MPSEESNRAGTRPTPAPNADANPRGGESANDEAKNNAEANGTAFNDGEISTFTFGNSSNKGPTTSLSYPENLKDGGGDTNFVSFEFFEYVGPYENENTAESSSSAIDRYNSSAIRSRRKPAKDGAGGNLQKVLLYMPEDVQAQYATQWGGKSIQNITAGVLRGVGAAGGGDIGNLFQTLGQRVTSIPDDALVKAITTGIDALQKTGQAEGLGANDVLGLTRGVVLNPNTELLFAGFDLRTFSLNFKLVARSKTETESIRNIITTFKKAMLPSISEDEGVFGGQADSFIKVPSLVDVKFMAGASQNPFLTQFKPCAITGLNVNYTPDGSYAVYENFAPVAVNLQLQFSETKLVYKEDVYWGGATY